MNRLLDHDLTSIEGALDFNILDPDTISPSDYDELKKPVETVKVDVFLVCRKDLPEPLSYVILDALFDNIGDLSTQEAAKGINIFNMIDLDARATSLGVETHQGVEKFVDDLKENLLITTGAFDEQYYDSGLNVKTGLESLESSARVTHSQGSVQNALRLRGWDGHIVGIMQLDAVLDENRENNVEIQRLVTLHEERMHIIVSREFVKDLESEAAKEADVGGERDGQSQSSGRPITLEQLMNLLKSMNRHLTVSIGSEGSGTRAVADIALSRYSKISHLLIKPEYSVLQMKAKLEDGSLDAGFFMGHVPSSTFGNLLNSDRFRLVSLDPRDKNSIISQRTGLYISQIQAHSYACQTNESFPIDTVSTRALLVATESLDERRAKIVTKAAFARAAHLGIEEEDQVLAMQKEFASVNLHPGALHYYQDEKYFPRRTHPIDELVDNSNRWLNAGWRVLAILVILAAIYQGVLEYRRNKTSNEIGRRILTVPVESGNPESVGDLVLIRGEIQERVQRRWWRNGEINRGRWGTLHELIGERIVDAQKNVSNGLVAEIRAVSRDERLEKNERLNKLRSLQWRILGHFSNGELNSAQHDTLLELIHGAEAAQNAVS